MTDRVTRLEEALAHQASTIEDLNAIVTDQTARIETLERRVALLLQRAAEAESQGTGGTVFGDETPPHY
ncbi:MAG: SlyX family protein [Pseudomonadota bacterium]